MPSFNIGTVTSSFRFKLNKLFTWGSNIYARTGLNTTVGITLVPTQIGSDIGWSQADTQNWMSAAIINGRLYTFGWNNSYATGLNTTTGNTLVPTQASMDTNWESISVTVTGGYGIKTNGTLYVWGSLISTYNVPTQIGTDTDWKQVSNGQQQALFIKTNGKLYALGSNTYGQTGLNTIVGITSVPTQIGTDTDWVTCNCGLYNSYAIKSNGTLYSWGQNTNGATGLNTIAGNTLVPTQVGTDTGWTHVTRGSGTIAHCMGIKNGQLYGWGANNNARTGLNTIAGNTLVPTQVGTDTGWTDVGAGFRSAIGILNGKLYTWGENENASTGLNTTTGNTLVPTQASSETNWVSVSEHGHQNYIAIRI